MVSSKHLDYYYYYPLFSIISSYQLMRQTLLSLWLLSDLLQAQHKEISVSCSLVFALFGSSLYLPSFS